MEDQVTYKAAGVDIELGDKFVHNIKPLAHSTSRPGVMGSLGGFGALFDLKQIKYQDPILVTTTDGVGTKLRLAIRTGDFSTIGLDLVAMCVNDLVTQGAEPLTFLDYFATHKLDSVVAQAVLEGITLGCQLSRCALVGGETAEMPSMYAPGDLDLAGFALGAVERSELLPQTVRPGDWIIGLPSSGLHSNGFSLVNHLVEKHEVDLDSPFPCWGDITVAHKLLQPTRNYVMPVLALAKKGLIRAAAHITGGGIPGNLIRVLPHGVCANISRSWVMPSVFSWLQRLGDISAEEMFKVFNCGIGMIVVGENPGAIADCLRQECEMAIPLGRIESHRGDACVKIENMERMFGL